MKRFFTVLLVLMTNIATSAVAAEPQWEGNSYDTIKNYFEEQGVETEEFFEKVDQTVNEVHGTFCDFSDANLFEETVRSRLGDYIPFLEALKGAFEEQGMEFWPALLDTIQSNRCGSTPQPPVCPA